MTVPVVLDARIMAYNRTGISRYIRHLYEGMASLRDRPSPGDDPFPIDVTVFASVQPRVARTVFGSFVLAVRGTLRRTGVRGVSIVAEDVWDLPALQRARRDGRLAEALRHRGQMPPPIAAPPRAASRRSSRGTPRNSRPGRRASR